MAFRFEATAFVASDREHDGRIDHEEVPLTEYHLKDDIEELLATLGVEPPNGPQDSEDDQIEAQPTDSLGSELQSYFTFIFDLTLSSQGDELSLGAAREASRERGFACVGAVALQIAVAHPEWAADYLRHHAGNSQTLAENAETIFAQICRATE